MNSEEVRPDMPIIEYSTGNVFCCTDYLPDGRTYWLTATLPVHAEVEVVAKVEGE